MWNPDPTLDPTALRRRNKSQPKTGEQPAESHKEPPWTVERFVNEFTGAERQPKALIAAKAREKGIANRKVEDLIALALNDGKAFRWNYERDKTLYLANRSQTVLDVAGAR